MARRGSSRRTYVRDANGRFASTPGGGGPKRPATKPVKRGPNRLTRDNAGRITSQGGDGATVRGGRLKTAAGNLRGRQVAKLKTMQGVSYGKGAGKEKAKTDTTFRPGEFYRGNFRPRNITNKPLKQKSPFVRGSDSSAAEKNARIAKEMTIAKGIPARISSGSSRSGRLGSATFTPDGKARIAYNKSDPGWADIHGTTIRNRKSRWWSTSSPMAVVYHEIGHTKDRRIRERRVGGTDTWALASGSKSYEQRIKDGSRWRELARRRVSTYAHSSPSEFVAEVYSARRSGKKYDYEVMNAYKQIAGIPSKRLKDQKPIRRKRKP